MLLAVMLKVDRVDVVHAQSGAPSKMGSFTQPQSPERLVQEHNIDQGQTNV